MRETNALTPHLYMCIYMLHDVFNTLVIKWHRACALLNLDDIITQHIAIINSENPMRLIQSTLSGLLLLSCLNSSFAAKLQPVDWQQTTQQNSTIIDTRPSAFYNGWPTGSPERSGHEPTALNLSASWLGKMDDSMLKHWLQEHNLTPDSHIAFYGSKEETDAVAEKLQQAGYKNLALLQDALQQPDRLIRLTNYQELVYPAWLRAVQEGKPVHAAPAKKWRVIEVAWGAPKKYLISHIPNAGYIDTNDLESEPLWNVVSAEKINETLTKAGVDADTTVILYGRDMAGVSRVAHVMLYAGVKDVRLLDGGWQSWDDAGYPVERGLPANVTPVKEFGVTIPAQPQLMKDMAQAKDLLNRQDASLVSIRTWDEFIGTTSGYKYIKPKGDIPGARWGHAGSDAFHLEDYHNPDGTMRSADDITKMLQQWKINKDQDVAFYCGTGWRASEVFMYTRAMGWPNVSVYDGGWYEWSSHADNPQVQGERKPQ